MPFFRATVVSIHCRPSQPLPIQRNGSRALPTSCAETTINAFRLLRCYLGHRALEGVTAVTSRSNIFWANRVSRFTLATHRSVPGRADMLCSTNFGRSGPRPALSRCSKSSLTAPPWRYPPSHRSGLLCTGLDAGMIHSLLKGRTMAKKYETCSSLHDRYRARLLGSEPHKNQLNWSRRASLSVLVAAAVAPVMLASAPAPAQTGGRVLHIQAGGAGLAGISANCSGSASKCPASPRFT